MRKFLGLILIVVSCTGLGVRQCMALSARLSAMETLLRMAVLIKGEIRFGNAALGDAFDSVSGRLPGAYGAFLQEAASRIRRNDGTSIEQIFRECAKKHFAGEGMKKEEQELLYALGRQLGYLDLEMQLKQLTLYEEELVRMIGELRREMPGKKKVYQSLGLLGGILLAVLIW